MTGSRDDLLQQLRGGAEQRWLDAARQLVLAHNAAAAAEVLAHGIAAHPQSDELLYALAGALSDAGQGEHAQQQLQHLLERSPDHDGAAMLLARLRIADGRTAAAARVLEPQFDRVAGDPERVIQIVELLDDAGRKHEASRLCEAAIEATPGDVRLYAYAAMLLAQLGEFGAARQRYLYVAAHSELAPDWHVPLGLAALQRYRDPQHPDLALFARYLEKPLGHAARASLLFALGKAHDDLEELKVAVDFFRQANALSRSTQPWSRKLWRRSIEARRQRHLTATTLTVDETWVPVFVVGMPRSGSTLLAELLARHPQIFHRGESPWLPRLAARIEPSAADYPEQLARAAAAYTAQLRQDDNPARWVIDKQPSNYLEVDLILSMFPQARIIYCQRQARDSALSVWMQSFQDGNQAFAYDLDDIGAVIRGSRQLMAHWQQRFAASIWTVSYESLVDDPLGTIDALAQWLGLPNDAPMTTAAKSGAISTASLWQARQPVHRLSVERWRAYVPYVPELLQLPQK